MQWLTTLGVLDTYSTIYAVRIARQKSHCSTLTVLDDSDIDWCTAGYRPGGLHVCTATQLEERTCTPDLELKNQLTLADHSAS